MIDGVVVDTNIMIPYIKEWMLDDGHIYDALIVLQSNIGFAYSDQTLFEWEKRINALNFTTWFEEASKKKQLAKVDYPKLDPRNSQHIHKKIGLPENSRDKHFIRCACCTSTKYIVTNDIDFYEPKAKDAPSNTKERIKKTRCGSLCRYLTRELNIRVGNITHIVEEDFKEWF